MNLQTDDCFVFRAHPLHFPELSLGKVDAKRQFSVYQPSPGATTKRRAALGLFPQEPLRAAPRVNGDGVKRAGRLLPSLSGEFKEGFFRSFDKLRTSGKCNLFLTTSSGRTGEIPPFCKGGLGGFPMACRTKAVGYRIGSLGTTLGPLQKGPGGNADF